ncbi:hypothetical protein DASC09_003550 [Saccharomycopsis crataegensis]|uniref:Peptidase A1 domain-containing protein n=1 Tax=Saccharomycopsis crataegensis TaxID=43959 RepID=A0AAV5QEZ4_9ASCO|nr:hypothetical protein DASC09_003550 [Saccharomycopsis crataegensis]
MASFLAYLGDALSIQKRFVNITSTTNNVTKNGDGLLEGVAINRIKSTISQKILGIDSNKTYVHMDFAVQSSDELIELKTGSLQRMATNLVSKTINTDNGVSRNVMRQVSAMPKYAKSLLKRQHLPFENIVIQNKKVYYSVELEVGSDNQPVSVVLDTGSSDLWVPTFQLSAGIGYFNPDTSTSYQSSNSSFGISYGDGTYAIGTWGNDTVSIGEDVNVNNVILGVVDNCTASQGVLGIGLQGNEAQGKNYSNMPMLLQQQGYLDNITYSLYLDSADSGSGSILFGAIDLEKYQGELTTLPLVNINDGGMSTEVPVAFFVNVTSIDGTDSTLAETTYPGLLDSGTTLLYAPTEVYEAIGEKYGMKSEVGYVHFCDAWKGQNLTFNFENDLQIRVPMDDMMYKLSYNNGSTVSVLGLDMCLVGVLESPGDYYVLGDNFLRSAYVHYDLTNGVVSMAQVKYTDNSLIQLV